MSSKWFWMVVLALLAGCASERFGENYPLAQGEHRAKLNGLELWYKVSGCGPVCVFPTPGWGPSSDIYFASMKPMEEHFTIVYLDTRGTGRSERPKTLEEYTWKHLADDIEALRCHLGLHRIWLMGHSNGGVIVMHYALEYPNPIAGLLILDSAAASEDEFRVNDWRPRWEVLAKDPSLGPLIPLFLEGENARTEAEFIENSQKTMPLFFSSMESFEKCHSAFASGFEATTISFHAWQGQKTVRLPFSLVDRLDRIKVPTLLVVGADDVMCSLKESQRLHLGIPNSRLLVIEKAGHFPWMEQPEEFFFWVRKFLPTMGYPEVK